MNAARIMRRPWVHQITTINMPRVLVTLAPGKVFATTGKRTQEFESVAKAYEGTNRLLIAQDPERFVFAQWQSSTGYLSIRKSPDTSPWEPIAKFPNLETAQDYAHSVWGIAVVAKGY